jgi:peptide deformylase
MSILKIARMGHPVLRAIARPIVDPTAPEIRRLAEDMIETVNDVRGAGLAAPQIHVSQRLVVFKVTPERSTGLAGDDPIAMSVIVNPVLEPVGDECNLDWEGCLSIPGLRGAVPRYTHIRYTGFDLDGNAIDRTVAGFHARVLQHECDHLDGVLYPERMTDLSLLCFTEEGARYPIDLGAVASEGEKA